MLKNGCWIILMGCLSFSVYAEPTENQLYPNYGATYNQNSAPYGQTSSAVASYPYSPLPTQVYPNSQQPQDYYPYGQQSTSTYYYAQPAECPCRRR